MAEAQNEQVSPQHLDLDDVNEGTYIRYKEQEYRLKAPDEFTMQESARVRRLVRQMQTRLDIVDDLDIEEDDEKFQAAVTVLDTEADRLLTIILDMPKAMIKEMDSERKMRVLAFFTRMSWGTFNPSMISAISPRG